jgi:AP-1 complex subunit beta-1
MAALVRVNGSIQLQASFSNASQAPLNGFAIQVNKNPFGIGPATALAVPDIMVGSSAEISLPMNPGALSNNQAPTNPLFLQVAIKNSLDIFYFNVPFDLTCVLVEGPGVGKEQFSSIWQGVGEAGQTAFVGNMERPLDDEAVRTRMALDNVNYVAKRNVDDQTTLAYFAATTTNNLVVCAEASLRNGSNNIKVVIRTQSTPLVPLFEAVFCKRLGITR